MESSAFFDDVVAVHTGPEFVRRRWLEDEISSALDGDECRYVLLTAEPGAGKTGLIAELARSHPQWPRYFIRRDSRASLTGGDVQSFLLSIGHQLASVHPELFRPELLEVEVKQRVDSVLTGGRAIGVRIDDLTVSPFYRTAVLRLDQTAGSVSGTMIGVEIGQTTLEPRLLEPANLAHLALIAPAVALAASHPEQRIVVLVDALDEVADDIGHSGLLEWLESGPELPSNVRFVLTSRTHSKLELFRRRRVGQLVELTIDPASPAVRGDLRSYAVRVVGDEAVTAAIESQGFEREDLVEAMASRAEGNFAYLVAYGRALRGAIERLDEEFRNRLLRFSDVPMGLDGLYGFFMESIRTDISRMGMMEVREPVSAQDLLCPAWESVGQPVLGILVVARDVVTLDQVIQLSRVRVWRRDVANVVARLRQFLDTTGAGMRLFHSSLAEYLVSAEALADHPEWAVEEEEWHERIAQSYRGTTRSWRVLDWSTVDTYGLRHLATHVSRCRPRVADEVVELVTPGLRRQLRTVLGTDHDFLTVTDIASDYALRRLPPARSLPAVLFIGLVARQVDRAGVGAPPAVVGLLARHGRVDEALAYVRLLQPSWQQFLGMAEIVRHVPSDQVDAQRRRELHDELVRYATAVPPENQTLGTSHSPRRKSIEQAAALIAGTDLGRALRLCKLSQSIEPGAANTAAADEVYRCAAMAAEPGATADHAASMTSGRTPVYLDLARRSSAHPDVGIGETVGLLERAEAWLSEEGADSLPVCLARLAVAWHQLDAGAAGRCVDALGRLARHGLPEKVHEQARWHAALVAAAATLTELDPVTAAELVQRVEMLTVDGHNSRAMLDAARLLRQWGQDDRSVRLLNDVLRQAETNPIHAVDTAEIAAMVADFDPDLAATLTEEALRQVEPWLQATDVVNALLRDGVLRGIALAVSRHNPARALQVVQQLPSVTWQEQGASIEHTDRASVLAELAHMHLAQGRDELAGQALDAALDTIASAARDASWLDDPDDLTVPFAPSPVTGQSDVSVPDRSQSVGSHDLRPANVGFDFRTQATTTTYTFNTSEQWKRRLRRAVFTDPVAIARAALAPPFAIGTPYSWDRTLRVMVEAVAAQRLDLAVTLLDRIEDNAERAIGYAAVARCALRAGDTEEARRLSSAAMTTLDVLPRFAWRGKVADQAGALAYMLPDQRTRFEVAVRLQNIDAETIESPLLRLAYRASQLCTESERYVSVMRPGNGWPSDALQWHQTQVAEVSGWPDPQLRHVTVARLIANERILRDRGSRDPAGNLVPGPPVVPLSVGDTAYAAVADLLCMRAGLSTLARLTRSIRDLMTHQQMVGLQLAALTVGSVAPADPAEPGESLSGYAIETARGLDNRYLRGLALARLAKTAAPADRTPLVEEATRDLDELGSLERGELLAEVYPTMVTVRPEDAARLLLAAIRTRWRESMALLEWAAPALVHEYGIDIMADLAHAVGRAREFAIETSTVDPLGADRSAPPHGQRRPSMAG